MNTTIKQFVENIYKAWNDDIFLSATPIKKIRCRVHNGMLDFTVLTKDGGHIVLFDEGYVNISFF